MQIVAASASVLLHLVLVLAIIYSAIWKKRESSERTAAPVAVKPDVVMSLHITPPAPEKSIIVVPKEIPNVVKPEQPKYVRTDASQLQGKAENTNRIGAHDTLAQSTAKSSPDALDQAATQGRKEEDESSITSHHRDGEKSNPAASASQEQKQEMVKPTAPTAQQESITKSAPRHERHDFLESENKTAARPRGDLAKPKITLPDTGRAEQQKKRLNEEEARKLAEQLEQRRLDALAKMEQEKRKQQQQEQKKQPKSEFSPATHANKSIGSISRMGKVSSQNTKATPTGRYTAAVIDAVAREWYRRCSSHRDLLVPGSLTVRWFVDTGGKIKHLSIVDERQGGEIQKGITVQSINSAKIPTMSSEVRKELNGDPIQIQINFEF